MEVNKPSVSNGKSVDPVKPIENKSNRPRYKRPKSSPPLAVQARDKSSWAYKLLRQQNTEASKRFRLNKKERIKQKQLKIEKFKELNNALEIEKQLLIKEKELLSTWMRDHYISCHSFADKINI